MILRAAREHNLDLANSILIGDRCSDIAAANAAGLHQAFLIQGTEAEPMSRRAHRHRTVGRSDGVATKS